MAFAQDATAVCQYCAEHELGFGKVALPSDYPGELGVSYQCMGMVRAHDLEPLVED